MGELTVLTGLLRDEDLMVRCVCVCSNLNYEMFEFEIRVGLWMGSGSV